MTSLLLTLAALLPGQNAQVELKTGEKLGADNDVPVAFSPDGKALLFLKEEEGDTYTYWLAGPDGTRPRELYRSPVDWNDVLVGFVSPCCFSRDGKKVAVVSTKGGGAFRRAKDPLRGGYCTTDGRYHAAPAEHGFAGGTFASDRYVYLDSSALERDKRRVVPGYALKTWDGKAAAVLDSDKELGALVLRAAPDGSRVAFFVAAVAGGEPDRTLKLRVVDLKTRKAVDSEPFRSDDVTYDGPPLFYWDAQGKGVFYHKSPDDANNRPFNLMYFDPAKKKSKKVLKEEDVGVLAVLDRDHLAVLKAEDRRCGILRLSDQKLFPLPEGWKIMGGSGNRLVLASRRGRGVVAAEFRLPKGE